MADKPYSEDLELERLLSERVQTAKGIFQLAQSLQETFEYFMGRIKELEARVDILERRHEGRPDH